MKISVAIIAKNEARHIVDCLESLKFVDDIVLVDDFSSDDTAGIAKKHGARTYRRQLDGFATQKWFAISKTKHDWVLIIDADERVTDGLRNEIENLIADQNVAFYQVPRRNFIGSKELKHGGLWPDLQDRLINKTKCKYDGREVHEKLIPIQGHVEQLDQPLIHYTYDSLHQYYRKVIRYSRQQASEDLRLGRQPSRRPVLWREFAHKYIRLQGWRDGWYGLISALLLAYYQHLYWSEIKRLAS